MTDEHDHKAMGAHSMPADQMPRMHGTAHVAATGGHDAHQATAAGAVTPHAGHVGHGTGTKPAASGGHDHAAMMADPSMAAAMEREMRGRFLVSFVLTIPVIIYSSLGNAIFGGTPPAPFGLSLPWMGFLLSTPVVLYGGWVFIRGTYYALRSLKLDMSVLITTGVAAAYLFSAGATIGGGKEVFFEAASMLITFVLFGHWMEMRSRRGTTDALRALLTLVPETAILVRDGQEREVPTNEIVPGDLVRVRAGQRVPIDGEIIKGSSSIDESLVTGESLPVDRVVGDAVVAGSVNGESSLLIRASGTGSETALGRIITLVQTAQASRAPAQRLADRAAAVLVIVAVGSGVVTLLSWLLFSNASVVTALTFAISAVVIACPDALGLATPTAVAVGTGLGARQKVLIKDAATLERVSAVNAVILDKTGTITEGHPRVVDVWLAPGTTEPELFRYGAALETSSTHPLAQAIVTAARERGLADLPGYADTANVPGEGTTGTVDGKPVVVGSPALLQREGVAVDSLTSQLEEMAQAGRTVVAVAIAGQAGGLIALSDVIRPSAATTVAALKSYGIEVALLTGDNAQTAHNVASQVGIDRVFAGVKPGEKADYVGKLQAEGRVVAMVGDGINDAPALAAADVGIAIGAGTDVAIETASVVLMRSDPIDILKAIRLSKATVRKMKENLFWASIYNVLAIPLAGGALYSTLGLQIRPEIAALLMSVSSIVVATNAVLLRREGPRLDAISPAGHPPTAMPLARPA